MLTEVWNSESLIYVIVIQCLQIEKSTKRNTKNALFTFVPLHIATMNVALHKHENHDRLFIFMQLMFMYLDPT